MECRTHKLVADVAVIAEGAVLMVRYKNPERYDGQTGWFLPDDFLAHKEHPDLAAARIAKEQLGTVVRDPRLGFVESFGNGGWHLIFHYRVDPDRKPRVKAGKNVAAVEWFDLRELPATKEIAHHGWARSTLARLAKTPH